MERSGEGGGCLPLFETREAKGRVAHKLLAFTTFVGICSIWIYRLSHVPRAGEPGRWAWIGLFVAELWFGLYWVITQSVRWKIIYRYPFRERLSHRYGEELPGVDIFVCTADPSIEPPTMVINTVLSVMAYDYPPQKLSVYLSDDGGSDLTFYALVEASRFSNHWIPFSKKFKVEPRSPAAYFTGKSSAPDQPNTQEWFTIKKLYDDMTERIESVIRTGRVPEEIKQQHKGFSEWNSAVTKRNHQTILQVLIDGRDPKAVDTEGQPLPTLVYLAREKRPDQYHHNFKAGAINALLRVSKEISNGAIVLNVDCDMYSNDSKALKDALCFFLDEDKGHEIAYVQFPQNFDNIPKHDIYSNLIRTINDVELSGADGWGGAFYCGTGCFHRRDALCGRKYSKDCWKEYWNNIGTERKAERGVSELEETAKVLANCEYEIGTQWGKEMGLKYGCPVEDILTGLSIQCRGWKPVYYNPDVKGFLGLASFTLSQTLIQHKRWSEGFFQIFLSKYCPFLYGYGKITFGLQMGYSVYCLWALNSLPTLYYAVIPSLYLLKGIPLFPKMSSIWFLPFAYVFISKSAYSLAEALCCGDTLIIWWNQQRMWLIRRTTSYLFAFVDTIIKQLGFSELSFVVTAKLADKDEYKRYEQGIMEFGTASPMFTIISTLAMFNLFSLVGGIKRVTMDNESRVLEKLFLQFALCGLLVVVNIPVYQALFIRKDKGRMLTSITFTSIVLASLACLVMPTY